MAESKSEMSRRHFLLLTGSAAASLALPTAGRSSLGTRGDARPNILFFFPDQHRFDWLGSNPEIPVPSPNLNALGRRGIRFSNAVCPSPVCAPSRACLASGMEYENCGVAKNRDRYPAEKTTFYRHLRNSGYHTMACGKIDLYKGTPGLSIDGRLYMEEWGFSDMQITGSKAGPLPPRSPTWPTWRR